MASMRSRFGPALAGLVLAIGVGPGSSGFADQIVLRGGGQVRGKVMPDPTNPGRVNVFLETGKRPLTFQKPQILQVVPEPSVLDEYVARRAKAQATAQEQYDLGLWCEEHKLRDLAEVHLEAAVERDPSFAPAHQKLGHVLQGDRWLSGDELREAQGLVRYKGAWITKEERAEREEKASAGAELASWTRRIKLLRQAIATGTDERAQEADQQLHDIHEPVAVSPLMKVLGQDVASFRALLDEVLGGIPGPEAASALVRRILAESDPEVRDGTMNALEGREDPNIVRSLVKALKSTSPVIVNRAAWALSHLNAVATVPSLVPALVTTQYQVVFEPAASSGGGGFESVGPDGVPAFYNGSSLGLLTGPVVGPGVAAFGATSVPFVGYGGGNLSLGNGGVTPGNRGPVPKLVPYTYQNVEVLAALVKMTGRNFGYDVPTWRRWVSTSFRPDPVPARKVPQP